MANAEGTLALGKPQINLAFLSFISTFAAMKQEIIISEHLERDVTEAVGRCEYDRLFVLTDATTHRLCWPLLSALNCLREAQVIVIMPTDAYKNIESLSQVWTGLQQGGATRHSLLLNVGGGMVTDLGGFAAATFKRGIQFINIPTTLLAQVDASVGGKTGINFGGFKNEVGVFCDAKTVILCTRFLETLDRENLRSGYAEMLKHGLISTVGMWTELMDFNLAEPDLTQLQQMVARLVGVKERIVEVDPREQGIRKALNLGHTIGHAIESWSFSRPSSLLHGYAVAFGLVCELYLSAIKTGFPTDKLRQTTSFIREYYGMSDITCDDYPTLFELMTHDKKNTADRINFTLLGDIGDIRINQTATREEIYESLDFLREG